MANRLTYVTIADRCGSFIGCDVVHVAHDARVASRVKTIVVVAYGARLATLFCVGVFLAWQTVFWGHKEQQTDIALPVLKAQQDISTRVANMQDRLHCGDIDVCSQPVMHKSQ